MITRIEALNFRCLRYVSQRLGRFHVLVGPNASGKEGATDIVLGSDHPALRDWRRETNLAMLFAAGFLDGFQSKPREVAQAS